MDVLTHLADGVSGLRIGVLEEGFDEAEVDVRDLVMAAIDVLARAGADVSKVSIPAHHAIRTAQAALTAEGALALFHTGFFGAFTRTYYPASLIAAINQLWASQADVLAPRTKLSGEALFTGDTGGGERRGGVLMAIERKFDERWRGELGLRLADGRTADGTGEDFAALVRGRLLAHVPEACPPG